MINKTLASRRFILYLTIFMTILLSNVCPAAAQEDLLKEIDTVAPANNGKPAAGDGDDLLKEIDAGTTPAAGPSAPSTGNDLLKEMDTAQPDTGKPGPKAKAPKPDFGMVIASASEELADTLHKNLHGSLRLRAFHFFQNAAEREGADTRKDYGTALLKFTDKVKVNNWDFNIGGWLEFGNEENTYAETFFHQAVPDWERRRHLFEINELFTNYSGTNYNLVLGKKAVTNGLSTLYSPADRLRPQDLNDPMDPKDLNLWQARLDYFTDSTTLSAAFLPVYQTNKMPSESSRWMGERKQGDALEADMYDSGNLNMQEDRPKLTDNNFGYFLRGKTTYKGWDLFASYYHGPNPFYVVREEQRATAVPGVTEPVRIKEVIKVDTWAAGFSTTHEKWEFHGEAIYNYSYDGKDDNYLSYVGGATYTIDDWAKKVGLEKIDITAEYANEIITNFQNAAGYVSSSKKSRLGRNDILSRVNLEYSDKLSFQFLSNFTLTYGAEGRFQKFQTKYKFRDGLTGKLAVEIFGGQSDSLYGRWYRNDRAIVELEYSF